mmetsp:Transcript_18931/g.52616  ORF Transcript_18931/g.52616 Transcript_18931/m.52616 type:complete len:207 (-) Transcript_18931:110-730(-)
MGRADEATCTLTLPYSQLWWSVASLAEYHHITSHHLVVGAILSYSCSAHAVPVQVQRLFFGHQCLDLFLDLLGHGDDTGLGDEELGAEVPGRIRSSSLIAHEVPHLWNVVAGDLAELHEDAREVLAGGECLDLLVGLELLRSELPTREGQDGQSVSPPLPELLETSILAAGQTSFGCDVGGVHHHAFEFLHRLVGAVAAGCGQCVE